MIASSPIFIGLIIGSHVTFEATNVEVFIHIQRIASTSKLNAIDDDKRKQIFALMYVLSFSIVDKESNQLISITWFLILIINYSVFDLYFRWSSEKFKPDIISLYVPLICIGYDIVFSFTEIPVKMQITSKVLWVLNANPRKI